VSGFQERALTSFVSSSSFCFSVFGLKCLFSRRTIRLFFQNVVHEIAKSMAKHRQTFLPLLDCVLFGGSDFMIIVHYVR
jgi:hypothetical protein